MLGGGALEPDLATCWGFVHSRVWKTCRRWLKRGQGELLASEERRLRWDPNFWPGRASAGVQRACQGVPFRAMNFTPDFHSSTCSLGFLARDVDGQRRMQDQDPGQMSPTPGLSLGGGWVCLLVFVSWLFAPHYNWATNPALVTYNPGQHTRGL